MVPMAPAMQSSFRRKASSVKNNLRHTRAYDCMQQVRHTCMVACGKYAVQQHTHPHPPTDHTQTSHARTHAHITPMYQHASTHAPTHHTHTHTE